MRKATHFVPFALRAGLPERARAKLACARQLIFRPTKDRASMGIRGCSYSRKRSTDTRLEKSSVHTPRPGLTRAGRQRLLYPQGSKSVGDRAKRTQTEGNFPCRLSASWTLASS